MDPRAPAPIVKTRLTPDGKPDLVTIDAKLDQLAELLSDGVAVPAPMRPYPRQMYQWAPSCPNPVDGVRVNVVTTDDGIRVELRTTSGFTLAVHDFRWVPVCPRCEGGGQVNDAGRIRICPACNGDRRARPQVPS